MWDVDSEAGGAYVKRGDVGILYFPLNFAKSLKLL